MPPNRQFLAYPPVKRTLKFVGSVKMAGLLLVFGVLVAGIGFATAWFNAFLILVGLNLAAAVLNRLPLGRRQYSFFVVHLALIGLLAGAWVSGRYGFEGAIILQEGEDTCTLEMPNQEVVILERIEDRQAGLKHAHVLQQFPLPAIEGLAGYPLLREEVTGIGLEIVETRHNVIIQSSLEASPQGLGPGVQFQISGAGHSVDSLLLANHPDFRRLDLGPLDIEILSFRRQEDFDLQASASPITPGITIEFADGTPNLRIPLPSGVGQEYEAGAGIFVTVASFAEHARVKDGRFVNIPSATPNPAAEVLVRQAERKERHIIFSQFPDFNIHEMDESMPMTASMRLNTPHVVAQPLLTLLCDPEGRLHTQVTNGNGRQAAVQLPQANHTAIATTPYEFTLLQFVPLAAITTDIQEAATDGQRGTDLLKMRILDGELSSEFWLELGKGLPLPIFGQGRSLVFRHQVHELPFRIGLQSMEVSYYPNSHTASGYSSNVLVAATEGMNTSRSLRVAQSHPTDFMGYRLQQGVLEAGEEGAPLASIISVSYDPGVPILYGAFILLILGVGWYVLSDGPANRMQRARRMGKNSASHIEVVLSPKELSGGGTLGPEERAQLDTQAEAPAKSQPLAPNQPQEI